MDISALGHASFKIKGKAASLVTDPYDLKIGFKFPKTEADIVTVSHDHHDHNASSSISGEPFIINGPGEYEVKGISVVGVSAFHDDKKGEERGKNVIYNIEIEGLNIAHLGDLGQEALTSQQVEEIGNVDILLIPVGGFFTIDAAAAAKISAQLEPKLVIPMHYQEAGLEIPQLEGVDKFLKEMAKEVAEPTAKLTISKDKLPEELQIILLERASS